jgi:hypothetical protein
MTQEEWLLSNTFYCPELKIKLTPERCNESRKGFTKEVKRAAVINGIPLGDLPPCSVCKNWKLYSSRVGKSREDEEAHREVLQIKITVMVINGWSFLLTFL